MDWNACFRCLPCFRSHGCSSGGIRMKIARFNSFIPIHLFWFDGNDQRLVMLGNAVKYHLISQLVFFADLQDNNLEVADSMVKFANLLHKPLCLSKTRLKSIRLSWSFELKSVMQPGLWVKTLQIPSHISAIRVRRSEISWSSSVTPVTGPVDVISSSTIISARTLVSLEKEQQVNRNTYTILDDVCIYKYRFSSSVPAQVWRDVKTLLLRYDIMFGGQIFDWKIAREAQEKNAKNTLTIFIPWCSVSILSSTIWGRSYRASLFKSQAQVLCCFKSIGLILSIGAHNTPQTFIRRLRFSRPYSTAA